MVRRGVCRGGTSRGYTVGLHAHVCLHGAPSYTYTHRGGTWRGYAEGYVEGVWGGVRGRGTQRGRIGHKPACVILTLLDIF